MSKTEHQSLMDAYALQDIRAKVLLAYLLSCKSGPRSIEAVEAVEALAWLSMFLVERKLVDNGRFVARKADKEASRN